MIITASPGYAHYPWNTINFIPLILLNIFGAPTLQRNILRVIYNSQTTQNHAARWISKSTRDNILYAPLASLPPNHVRELGKKLRHKINISENDFVFGRIGRADNAIFDPIAIHAWKQIAHSYPQAHYLIMSPPPILVSIVEKEKIPRVHFLPPSGKEEDVWAFHGAIDCFAHFRRDGETSGVAIAESLTVGNPVITHKSHIWNAHLEYLSEKCARIAGHDDVAGYATFMSEYIRTQSEDKATWKARCEAAYLVGKKNFSPLNYAKKIYAIVRQLCDKNC